MAILPSTLSPSPSDGPLASGSSACTPSGPDGRFPYQLSRWTAVDDRVRGGSSISHLDRVDGGVRFWGTLDTQTLGGAGFASQSYTFKSPLSLPISLYTGLLVQLLPRPATFSSSHPNPLGDDLEKGRPALPTRFVVILKTEEASKRKDGRNEAVTSWEAEFDIEDVYAKARSVESEKQAKSPLTSSTNLTVINSTEQPSILSTSPSSASQSPQVRLLWPSFVATYRGRPIETVPGQPTPRLDPSKIVTLSLMSRSNFARQEGEFECFVRSIDPIDRSEWSKERGRKKGLKDMGLGAWLWMWLLRFIGR